MGRLTAEQMKDRAALVVEFRAAVVAAVWEVIESCPPELLASDDGTPYSSLVTESLRTSSLDQMVNAAAKAACESLRNWL